MTKRITKEAGIGSAFDDFLKEEGTYEATQAVAIKRVRAWRSDRTGAGSVKTSLDRFTNQTHHLIRKRDVRKGTSPLKGPQGGRLQS